MEHTSFLSSELHAEALSPRRADAAPQRRSARSARSARLGRFATALVLASALLAAGCADDDPEEGPSADPDPAPTTEPADPDPEPADPEPEGPEPADDPEPEDSASGEDESVDAAALRDDDPAEYTRHLVAEAIERYEADGLDAAVEHYSDPAHVDGSWYVFMIDGEGDVLAHYQPDRVGESLLDWVGIDANGYEFGPEMLAADEAGRWVPYVYTNPASGGLGNSGDPEFELKNAWVVRHDGLLFGSGWYVGVEKFLPQLVSEAAEHFRSGGLEAMLAFYNEPLGISSGLIPAAEYYNNNLDALDGYLSGFTADPDGEILAHFDPALIGTDIVDLLGPAVRFATPEGRWITSEDNREGEGPSSMRVWAMDVDGYFVAAGWYDPSS